MKLLSITLILLAIVHPVFAQHEVTIIPAPANLKINPGTFTLTSSTAIIATKGTNHEAAMLNLYLSKLYGFQLPVKKSGNNGIVLMLASGKGNPESYHLNISGKQVSIKSTNTRGIFLGIQTLLQLLPTQKIEGNSFNISLPQLNIYDYPAFGYRGMHLDVSRHFFDVDYVKKYIDYIAMQKFNTFHWHLTDDQGWRIEIKKYPLLTSVGGYRNGTIIGRYPGTGNDGIRYGGYYTQDQVKDIVRYASDRHITVIPEIEMPGHASAAIAAYPQLSCFPEESTKAPAKTAWAGPDTGKQVQQAWGVFPDVFCPSDYTFNFLENVLDEVMQLFPSKYIHIGGDECPKDNWKRSEFCQKLIKEKGLKDEHGLQSYFIQRIEKYLNSKGRDIIGWDEILEGGLAPNATVMSWRGEEGGIAAANQHHDVIMTPTTYVYFDYTQTKNEDSVTIGGFIPLKKVYNYNPIPKELDASKARYILGAQANVWTEYIHSPSKLEYMIFPRMTALSEVLWTPASQKNWDRFKGNLPQITDKYNLWGANYFSNSAKEEANQ